jgi:hypothetical protein
VCGVDGGPEGGLVRRERKYLNLKETLEILGLSYSTWQEHRPWLRIPDKRMPEGIGSYAAKRSRSLRGMYAVRPAVLYDWLNRLQDYADRKGGVLTTKRVGWQQWRFGTQAPMPTTWGDPGWREELDGMDIFLEPRRKPNAPL